MSVINTKPFADIYVSDSLGTDFKKSISNNARSLSDGVQDFQKLQGIKGVYIVNVYEHSKV